MSPIKASRKRVRYTPAFKLKVLRTALEKRLTFDEVRKAFGVGPATFYAWKKRHKAGGDAAVLEESRKPGPAVATLPAPIEGRVREGILRTKQEHPYFGVARVWQWLRRIFFLPVSYRQVRRAMKEENLVLPKPKKRRPEQPRRYERAKPNQMWCSDITEFRIGRGMTVHLIGFMDDHSRYVVAWGLYASCTTELVLEVLKNGFDSYGYPEEMLTDNGPQYKTWRGTTRFELALRREKIRHVLCGRERPQGNGKIEAFWGALKKEFVRRAPLGPIDEVRERLTHWMNFYNWQRPHEALEYATPAERYFQFAPEAKAEIRKRIKANEEALALGESLQAVGQAPAGSRMVEVRREGGSFVVRMDGEEIKRTELNAKSEEKRDDTQDQPGGPAEGDGRGGEGENGARLGGGIGEPDDLGRVPGIGSEGDLLLLAGGTPDGRHVPGGPDAPGAAGPALEGPGVRGEPDRGRDGGTPPGVPTDAVPGPDHAPDLSDEGADERGGATEEEERHGADSAAHEGVNHGGAEGETTRIHRPADAGGDEGEPGAVVGS